MQLFPSNILSDAIDNCGRQNYSSFSFESAFYFSHKLCDLRYTFANILIILICNKHVFILLLYSIYSYKIDKQNKIIHVNNIFLYVVDKKKAFSLYC